METLMSFMSVLAGMSFSLAIGLLAEELIFGKVFCSFFARQAARAKTLQKRSDAD